MRSPLPVLVLGAGGRGRGVYGPLLTGPLADRCRLTGIVSRTEASARAAGEALGVPWARFESLDDAARRWGARGAIVCPSSDQNAGCLRAAALELGLPVLVETPLALEAGEATRLADELARSGAVVEVAEQNPRSGWAALVAELARAGRLGRVGLVACDLASWRYHATAVGRDLLGRPRGRWAGGARVRLSGLLDGAGRPAWLLSGQVAAEGGGLFQLRDGEAVFALGSPWPTGRWAVYGSAGSAVGDAVRVRTADGRVEEGRIVLRGATGRIEGEAGAGLPPWTAALPEADLDGDRQAIARCVLDWLDRVEGGPGGRGPAEAAEDHRWIEAVERSAALGGARIELG